MKSYTSTTDPSTGGPRSPLFGTATFSSLSNTQTPLSPSRLSSSDRTYTAIGSNDDSDDASSERQMRRIVVSPPPTRDSDTYSYSDDNSIDDAAEVEAALSMIDTELANTEDALTQWSRGSSSVGTYSSYTDTATGAGTSTSYISTDYHSATNAPLDRDRRVLSTISERTENQSRPTSFAQSGGAQGSRPTTQYIAGDRRSGHLGDAVSPSPHVRAATEPSSAHTPGRIPNVPGRRAGELIAFFEDKGIADPASPHIAGHTRTTSVPMGPRSPSPYTTTHSRSMSTLGYTSPTSYGYGSTTGYGYSSRPSSPTKSRTGTTMSSSDPITTMSSLLSPPHRGSASLSDSRLPSGTAGTTTQTSQTRSTGTYSGSSTYTPTFTSSSYGTITATPTASSLRRPQTSPRSPLTSVRNIVAAWKERTPSLGKSARSAASSPSPPHGEGLFSLRRRAERGSARLREQALGGSRRSDQPLHEVAVAEGSGSGSASLSTSGLLPPPFDLAELGQYANAQGTQEPLRIGLLWYLNVHAPPPYRWQRCQALLYPHMLLLSWIAPGGGRGIVTLDLLNCTEVRSVPTPMHPTAQDDVGTIAAREQSTSATSGSGGQLGEMGLVETLCPFQLLYSDGIERLGAESARERVRWVSAIWEVLDRAVSIPDRSVTRSPTGSIRTIRSMTSATSSQSGSGSGSASTIYVPPLDSIPDLSDIQSLSGSSTLSRRPSLASAHHTRATDDAAVSNQAYLYPGDPRVIAPSRSSSIRRTSSLTDLDEEFASAMRRAREARPGLGFGLGLAGGILTGDGSPVTVSSGPRLGRDVYMSPPPSVGRSSEKARSRASDTTTSISDDAFFSAGSGSNGSNTQTSSFYSTSSFTRALTGTEDRTRTGLITDETVELVSGSGTNIVPSTLSFRGTTSASMLGDSHSGSSGLYPPTSPSRSGLTRSGGMRRRTPRSSSRSYSSSYTYSTDESSDKENSGSYSSGTRSATQDLSTLETLDSYTYSQSTRSRSVTPTPSSSSYTRSTEETISEIAGTIPSETSSDYVTAKSPTASFASLSTIPSLSDYDTADICPTDYATAEICPTEPSTDYETAEVCPTEPSTEYVTADICSTEVSTEYDTAECRCLQREEDVISITAPSTIPTIPSSAPGSERDEEEEFLPEDIPLPSSTYSPTSPSVEVEEEPELSDKTISSPSTPEPPTPESASTVSIPGPSPIPSESPSEPSISLPSPGPSPIPSGSPSEPSISLLSITYSPTESSVTPTMSLPTLSVPSTIEPPRTPSSPVVLESLWATESDQSYESSLLRASPSIQSLGLPDGPDTSFETSFLRPSGSIASSPEITLMTPITEISTVSLTEEPSTPSSELTPTPSTISLPPSVPSPTPVSSITVSSEPTEILPTTISRSLSTVSTVSSVSMSSDFDVASVFDLPIVVVEPSTEPSLLSIRVSTRSPSPQLIPLPPSPSPSLSPSPSPSLSLSTPSVSMSVSVSTPRGDVPSIMSDLTTIPSEAPSTILTHDVNRLLQYLHDVDETRGEENRDLADSIRIIRDELHDLSDFLRDKCAPEVPPPVPRKEAAAGGSSVISSDRSPSIVSSVRPAPAGPRDIIPVPRRRPISLSPPMSRIPSPETLSETMSFLSSHHSDDLSLLESESYPIGGPASPPWSSSSSESSSDASSFSSASSPPALYRSPVSMPIPMVREGSSPPESPPPSSTPSSSPTPSSMSSSTARPIQPISLVQLRDALDGIVRQLGVLSDGQVSANDVLNELRNRPVQPAMDERWGECCNKLRRMDDALQQLLDAAARGAPVPAPAPAPRPREEDTSTVDFDAASFLGRFLREQEAEQRARGPPAIHAPVPVRAGPSFEEQLEQIMASGPPPPQPPVQPPPPLTPLVYRPGPRVSRPRSVSPVFESELPPRARTVPVVEPVRFEPRRRPRPAAPRRTPAAPPPVPPIAPSDLGTDYTTAPPVIPIPREGEARGRRPEDDIDFDRRVRELRRVRHPDTDGFHSVEREEGPPARPPTAPADMETGREEGPWYRPAPAAGPSVVPPPGMVPTGAQPGVVPVAGPTVVQLPPLFNDIVTLLRENREAQAAGIHQQQDIVQYLQSLNGWLERDVQDRQAEIRGVSTRVEELAELLQQMAQALRRDGAPMPSAFPPPGSAVQPPVMPSVIVEGQQPFPPGFVPQQFERGEFPYERTPSPISPVIPGGRPFTEAPVIPPPPMVFGDQRPVIPPGPPPPGFPFPQGPSPFQQPQGPLPGFSPEFQPPRLGTATPSYSTESESSEGDRGDRITVIPPPQGPPHVTVLPGPQQPPGGPTTVIEVPTSRPSSPASPRRRPETTYEMAPSPEPRMRPEREDEEVPRREASPRREAHPQPPQQLEEVPAVHPEQLARPAGPAPAAPPPAAPEAGTVIIHPPQQPVYYPPGGPQPFGGQPMPAPERLPTVVREGEQEPVRVVISTERPRSPSPTRSRRSRRSSRERPHAEHIVIEPSRRSYSSRSSTPQRQPTVIVSGPPGQMPLPGMMPGQMMPGQMMPGQMMPGQMGPVPPVIIAPSRESRPGSPVVIERTRSRMSRSPSRIRVSSPRPHTPSRIISGSPSRGRRESRTPPLIIQTRSSRESPRRRGSRRDGSRYGSRSPTRTLVHEAPPMTIRLEGSSRGEPRPYREEPRRGSPSRRLHRPPRSGVSYSDESVSPGRDGDRRRRRERPAGTRRSRSPYSDREEPSRGGRVRPARSRSPHSDREEPSRGGRRPPRSRSPHSDREEPSRGGRRPSARSRSPYSDREGGPERPPRSHRAERPSYSDREEPHRVPPSEGGPPHRIPSGRSERTRVRSPPITVIRAGSPRPTEIFPEEPHRVGSPVSYAVPHRVGSPVSHAVPHRPRTVSHHVYEPSEVPEHVARSRSPSPTGTAYEREFGRPVPHVSRVPTRRATERPMSPVEGLREQLRRVPSGGTAIPYVPTIAPSEAPSRAPPHGEPFTRETAIPVSRTPPPVIVPEPTIRPAVSPPPRTVALAPSAQSGPGDLLYENAEREREEHFGDLERRMHDLIGASQEAEENRDANFRANEDERDRLFVQNERRRDEEAIQRRDEIWRELEDRLATLAPAAGEAPIPVPPPGGPPAEPEAEAAVREAEVAPPVTAQAPAAPAPDVASLLDVASRHSEELRDIVAAEREEFQRELAEQRAERDRALAELKATHDQIEEELRARIQLLTNELDSVRADLTRERELRSVEEMDRHERERAEMLEHDEAMRKQLSDITELVSEQRDEMANKREVMDQRWAETQERNEHKDAMCAELRRMVEQIIEQKEAEREEREQERARAAEQPTLQSILDTILQENASHRERLDQLANDWRADCERHKEETIASVRATANEQVPFNVQAYLDDFSRSLASEVRMLLGEVGKLREERRNLQFELGCMLTMKSKYGPGGEFDPDWRPTTGPCAAGAAEPPPPEAPPPPEEPIAAPSGWRPLHRGTRRQRTQQRAAAAPPPPPQPEVPPPAHLRGNMQSWATWLPDPNSDVTPPIRPSTLVVQTPSPPGLFGPRSPRGSLHQ